MPANALRLALRLQTHGERHAVAYHHMPDRLAASDDVDRRRRSLKVKRGRPAGPRMK